MPSLFNTSKEHCSPCTPMANGSLCVAARFLQRPCSHSTLFWARINCKRPSGRAHAICKWACNRWRRLAFQSGVLALIASIRKLWTLPRLGLDKLVTMSRKCCTTPCERRKLSRWRHLAWLRLYDTMFSMQFPLSAHRQIGRASCRERVF